MAAFVKCDFQISNKTEIDLLIKDCRELEDKANYTKL